MPGPTPPPALPPAPRLLHLRPEIGQLAALVEYLDEFAAEYGLAPADTHAFTLAAEELFANTIKHSDPPATEVKFGMTVDTTVATATYSDDAAAFDPTAFPEADTTLPLEQRPMGGLGIHFVRRTMQTFAYQRIDGRNVITFGRTLTHPAH